MEPQRIILANLPRLLKEMLERALTDAPGLRIVGETADWARLPMMIKETGVEWVIASLPSDPGAFAVTDALFAIRPGVRLLNVAIDGGHITVRWVEPHEQTIDEFSLSELITLLRDEPRDRTCDVKESEGR